MNAGDFKRQESRWSAVRRRTGWLATFALVLALAWVFGWSVSQRHHSAAPLRSRNSTAAVSSDPLLASKGDLPLLVQAERSRKVVYPYSVIPGGIRSIEELRNAIARDPVVSAHYAAFRLANARIIRLEQERTLHVSYRLGNKVYWTQRELKLAKGETLITDGAQTALTRCGNLIAEAIEGPVSPNEPTEQALNTPIPSPYAPRELESDDRFPEIQFVSDPGVPPPGSSFHSGGGASPNNFIPSGPPGPIPYPGGTTPPPVVRVPEPDTRILLLAGLLALLFVQLRKPKGAPKNVS
jgi:hypothetical protein